MKYFFLLILFCQFAFSIQKCVTYLSAAADPHKKVRVTKLVARDIFNIEDPNPLFVLSSSIEKGVLTYSINTKITYSNARPEWRPADAIDEMMKFYGNRVKKITVDWTVGDRGDNSEEFRKHLKAGRTEAEAAALTWSGKQAARYGYTKIKVDRTPLGGYYENVTVVFSKP